MTGFLIVLLCSALALPTVGASDFTVNPRDSTLDDGDQLTLSCVIPSVWSNSSIQWKKDGVLFDPHSLGFTVTPSNLSASFDSGVHTGSYTCHPGLHGYENFTSCPAFVKKAIINEDFNVVSTSIQGFVGGVAILPCAPPTSTPKPAIRWVRRGSGKKVPDSSEVLPSGDLYLHSLSAGDSGQYRCVVVNSVLQERKRGPYLTLNVSSVTRSTGTIEFYSRPADLVVKSGEVVLMPCAARGFPLPQYSWSYRHNETSDWLDLSHPPNVGYYNLSNVKLNDGGIYRCTAASSNGTQPSVQAVVTVKAAPQSVAIVQTVTSDAIQLTCDAMPASDYNIMWSIPKTATVVSGTTRDRVIAISRTASSAGIYQCRVYHEFGCISQEKAIEIEPHGTYSTVSQPSLSPSLSPSLTPSLGLLPPQVATSDYVYEATATFSPAPSPMATPEVLTIAFDPAGPIVLDEGQNFTLVCDASRGGHLQLLKDSSKVAEVVGNALRYPLVFVNKEHVGQYTCQLEDMGSVVVTTTIKVEVRAVRPDSPPMQPTVVWLSDKMIQVSWQPLELKPGQSVEGIKLNWGKQDPPKNYARLSVPVYNTSVVIDVNRTGTVYVSVWLYNRAGDGPTAVLNVTIPGPPTSTPIITPTTTVATPPTATTATPPASSPLPIVYFDPESYVAAVGEQVEITCRSGSLGPLEIIKDGSDTLSNVYSEKVVHYTLRSVGLRDTGLYHCIRESEGRTASFHLTVVDYKANCSVLSSNLIEVKVEPLAEIANVDISVEYIKIDRDAISTPTLQSKILPPTGVAVLDNLLPDTLYRIVVNKAINEGSKFKIGSCDNIKTFKPFEITREMVAVTNIGTDSIQVSLIKIQTELETRGIFHSNISVEVQVQVGGEWQTAEFGRTLTVQLVDGVGVLNVRIRIGSGDWAESDITFTSPMSTTLPTVELGVVYAVIIVGGVLFAGLVAVLVLIMKYVQINRREKDKVTDHRVERLSRQSSVRSTVSWSVKQHSISPDFKVDTSPKNPSSAH